MSARKPLIGVPACRKFIEPHFFHGVGEKYINALLQAADCLPVIVPAVGDRAEIAAVFDQVDGLFLTGSPSNVEPWRYDGESPATDSPADAQRDATTLPLIPAAVERGVPMLAVCRGFQEMNVAFGGSLHQKVQDVPGKLDHRAPKDQPLEVAYAHAHDVELVADGLLAGLAGTPRVKVNSLHSQGVDRLGQRLQVEATAPDGIIEAFCVEHSPALALGVQWHPEWQVMGDPFSRAMFRTLGDACRERVVARS